MKVILVLLTLISISAQANMNIMSCECETSTEERISRDEFGVDYPVLKTKRECVLKEAGVKVKSFVNGIFTTADTQCKKAAYQCVKYKTGVEFVQLHRELNPIRNTYSYKVTTGSGRVLKSNASARDCHETVSELRDTL